MRIARSGLVIGATLVALGTLAAPAVATTPGANGVIAYSQNELGANEIESVTPDGAIRRQLTLGSFPAWAGDGARFVFSDVTQTNQTILHTAAADGGDRQVLADPAGTTLFPAWSPDGTKIAFARFLSGNYDVWVADADGTDPVQLTSSPAEDITPSWSPDGSRIVYMSERDGDREVYVMDADGTDQTNLSNRHDGVDGFPSWSPDGSRIAYVTAGPGLAAVSVMNADGSGVTQLAQNAQWPAWSPDGTQIAFARSPAAGGAQEIYKMDADGSDQARLTFGGVDKVDPDWQPLPAARLSATTVTQPAGSIRFGDDLPFTATVTSGGSTPAGEVQLQVNGENDGERLPLDGTGKAVFETTFLLDAGDRVSATYGGSAQWGWSRGSSGLQVLPAGSATTIQAAPNPVTSGGTVDVSVSVANTSTAFVPFGSVQFFISGQPVGPRLPLDEDGGVAARLIADVPAGDYPVRVEYADDTAAIPDFEPSSASYVQRVAAPATGSPPSTPPAVVPAVRVVRKADLAAFAKLLGNALRKRGFAALRGPGALFSAVAPGTLTVRLEVQKGRKRVLLGTARRRFSAPGRAAMKVKLTRAGKRLLRRARKLRIGVRSRFVPVTGAAVMHAVRLTVKRRGQAKSGASARVGVDRPVTLSMRR